MRRLSGALLRSAQRSSAASAAPLRSAPAAAAAASAADVLRAALARLRPAGVAALHSPACARTTASPGFSSQEELLVEVRTGDVRGGGCAAPAALTFYGDDGESAELPLEHEEDSKGFLPGSTRRVTYRLAPLGRLRSLRVRLAPGAAGAADGWFLEYVRVTRRGDGDSFAFPCRRWLGSSDSGGGATFPLSVTLRPASACATAAAAQAVAEAEPAAAAGAPPPPLAPAAGRRLPRPLSLRCGAAATPHPDKVKAGARAALRREGGYAGEDAYFVSGLQEGLPVLALGVADGVYAWREQGIDAGLFSRALCAAATRAHAGGAASASAARGAPLRLLQTAFAAVRAQGVMGSSTACLVLVDSLTGRLSSANLGDSGYLLMTPARASLAGGAWQPGGVRYRSPHQEHEFGRPFQLGHHAASDAAEDAMLHEARLAPGDVLVLGTDGLWDNLHDSEVAAAVQAAVAQRRPPAAIAAAVVAAAHERSIGRGSTPYSVAATEAFDLVFSGGKRDDSARLRALA